MLVARTRAATRDHLRAGVTAAPKHEDRRPGRQASSTEIDAYWRAANYLSVGQIYLCDNPLLKRPLWRAT
jgi:phosphoketolase